MTMYTTIDYNYVTLLIEFGELRLEVIKVNILYNGRT